jgi:hypothetical protein
MPQMVLVISHRRSGAQWVVDAIRNNFQGVRQDSYLLDRLYRHHHLGKPAIPFSEFRQFIDQTDQIALLKTHTPVTLDALQAQPLYQEFFSKMFDRSQIIYVYRDGRDVMVSLYYYLMKHAQKPQTYGYNFPNFLRMEIYPDSARDHDKISRVRYWQKHVTGWLEHPNVLPVSYESLYNNYEETLQTIGDYLQLQRGVPRSAPITSGKRSLVQRLIGRLQQAVAVKDVAEVVVPPLPQASIGAWETHYRDEDLRYFLEHAGGTMRKLRYT